jgi:hypothetical protein
VVESPNEFSGTRAHRPWLPALYCVASVVIAWTIGSSMPQVTVMSAGQTASAAFTLIVKM